MANTDYLQLTLTGADENSITFKEWRQLINGTSASNMMKIDAGVSALNTALSGKADAEGNWTLLETVTTTTEVAAVQCSQSFTAKGIMATVNMPAASSRYVRLIDGTGYYKILMPIGNGSGTYSARYIIWNDHGYVNGFATTALYNANSTVYGIATAGNVFSYALTAMKIQCTSGNLPTGTTIGFYYRA